MVKFASIHTEKFIMKKIDGFFITMFFMALGLGAFLYFAHQSLTSVDKDAKLLAKIERQNALINLAKKIEELKESERKNTERGIASIPPAVNDANADLEFVVDTPLEAEVYAKKIYDQAKGLCYEPKREKECFDKIDRVVSHFPETVWAAESLVLLTDYYYRTKQKAKAKDVVIILKNDFKRSASIQEKVKIIERNL